MTTKSTNITLSTLLNFFLLETHKKQITNSNNVIEIKTGSSTSGSFIDSKYLNLNKYPNLSIIISLFQSGTAKNINDPIPIIINGITTIIIDERFDSVNSICFTIIWLLNTQITKANDIVNITSDTTIHAIFIRVKLYIKEPSDTGNKILIWSFISMLSKLNESINNIAYTKNSSTSTLFLSRPIAAIVNNPNKYVYIWYLFWFIQ